eukprot:c34249_g1_i1 orf=587-3136(-)
MGAARSLLHAGNLLHALGILSTLLAVAILPRAKEVTAVNVTYDHRSLVFDGVHRILNSGSIHYPRSTSEMWPDLIALARDGGLDVVETYVFWNVHEPTRGNYNFEGRFDLVKFVKEVHKAGLFVNLRIGPFISAEWNFGGLPVWLHLEPRVVFRTDNVPFKAEMQRFVTKIVDMMKAEKLFAWQGGPIILAQIENEFGSWERGTPNYAYGQWAANMAVSLNTGVPWIMCRQYDAPDPVINTVNSYYGDDFYPNGNDKPKMWTENWTGWFQTYGVPTPYRPVEDIAYAVSRFFQKNGSFQNYYMYHGGTNFGRTSGGPFITTSYDYDAPIDEYGLMRQPKWGHLKDLHEALKLCEPAMITGDASIYKSLGPKQEAFAFSNESESCAAFLANNDISNATVQFNGQTYDLPAWSVSILPNCKDVIFNSAKVTAQSSLMAMKAAKFHKVRKMPVWGWYKEKPGVWGKDIVTARYCVEQIGTTRDTTDYLWYTTSVQVLEDEPFLMNGTGPILVIDSIRDAVHVFVNGELMVSTAGDPYVEVIQTVNLHAGQNEIALLSMTVGLQAGGEGYDLIGTGIQGSVSIQGFRNGTLDISTQLWKHQIGLRGEHLKIYTETGLQNVDWKVDAEVPRNQSITWYKTEFDAPSGHDPVALDLLSMGKGQAWINGQSIGRFWPSNITSTEGCSSSCDYWGTFNSTKCATNCGEASQRWYHVPRSWLKPRDNLLVLFEEQGGDPSGISVVVRVIDRVCGFISEDYPPPINSWPFTNGNPPPQMRLQCGKGQMINHIQFASFGTPTGRCGNFQRGLCHAAVSLSIIEKECLGYNACFVDVSWRTFEENPCPTDQKALAVEAVCA